MDWERETLMGKLHSKDDCQLIVKPYYFTITSHTTHIIPSGMLSLLHYHFLYSHLLIVNIVGEIQLPQCTIQYFRDLHDHTGGGGIISPPEPSSSLSSPSNSPFSASSSSSISSSWLMIHSHQQLQSRLKDIDLVAHDGVARRRNASITEVIFLLFLRDDLNKIWGRH